MSRGGGNASVSSTSGSDRASHYFSSSEKPMYELGGAHARPTADPHAHYYGGVRHMDQIDATKVNSS